MLLTLDDLLSYAKGQIQNPTVLGNAIKNTNNQSKCSTIDNFGVFGGGFPCKEISLEPSASNYGILAGKTGCTEDPYMTQVLGEQAEARSRHEAWRVTLKPAPKHKLARLLPEEERHLQAFIKAKLIVAPKRGDSFYHMSTSDLWSLRAQYEMESGYVFSTRIDFFDYHVSQATGAQIMDGEDGQRWLVGVSFC